MMHDSCAHLPVEGADARAAGVGRAGQPRLVRAGEPLHAGAVPAGAAALPEVRLVAAVGRVQQLQRMRTMDPSQRAALHPC